MALPFGYKTEDSRYFAYLNQNSLRGGYRDKFTSPNVFTARQKRRMRHKARKHGEDLSYPELERRWAAWKARRRERDRSIERYRAVVQGRRDADAELAEICGVSYDHDWKQGDPECRRCGADLSEWNEESSGAH